MHEQEGIASVSQSVEKDVQTDVAGSDIDSLCHARLNAQDLTANLKYHVFDIERADADEARVSFYTGLPGHIVDTLAGLVCPHLMQKGSLVPFQQLMLTLMKLRLGLSQADLGYRFQISQSTVSRIFCHTIDAMFKRLR